MCEFRKAIGRNTAAVTAATGVVLNMQQMLLMHDLTAAGLRNDGEPADERAARAEHKLEECLKRIDEQKATLDKLANGAR